MQISRVSCGWAEWSNSTTKHVSPIADRRLLHSSYTLFFLLSVPWPSAHRKSYADPLTVMSTKLILLVRNMGPRGTGATTVTVHKFYCQVEVPTSHTPSNEEADPLSTLTTQAYVGVSTRVGKGKR